MRHECTCSHVLAPDDGVEPVGAVTTGLCAPCAAKMMRARGAFWYSVKIAGFQVELRIQPGRGEPHVSYDSPRRWDPSRPIRVIEQRVSHGGVPLDPADFHDLVALACERANVPAPGGHSVRSASSRQMRLRLSGLLRTAMERTGYGER